MSALPKAEAARLRGDREEPPEAEAEPEHQERSAMAKLAALRERVGPEPGLEDRLWAALDRSVSLLEVKLGVFDKSDIGGLLGGVTGGAEAIRNIAEAMDRLGMLKPPPVTPERDPSEVECEVWDAASEIGLSAGKADKLTRCLRERYEGRGEQDA